jgi:hypothetical protein
MTTADQKSDLVVVTIKTLQGSEYVFPDVPRSMLKTIIEQHGWQTAGSVLMVNVSGAVMSLPSRIVATVSYDGEVKWTGSPA